MNQNQVLTKTNYAEVGEEISHELAEKMIKDYHDINPNVQQVFHIGKNIIEKVLAQPGCVGMRFFNAINEDGLETLVYAGIDDKGNTIFEITTINESGKLGMVKALLGDKLGSMASWLD